MECGIENLLDSGIKVADLRIETISRAAKLSGGWEVVTLFEKMINFGGSSSKYDKVWKTAVVVISDKKKNSTSRPSQRGSTASRRPGGAFGYSSSRGFDYGRLARHKFRNSF